MGALHRICKIFLEEMIDQSKRISITAVDFAARSMHESKLFEQNRRHSEAGKKSILIAQREIGRVVR